MKIELRDDKVVLDGYVNVVGRDSRILRDTQGSFIEQVLPGTFEKALRSSKKVDILFNHDEKRKLSDSASDGVQLYEDNIGLRCIFETDDEEIREKAGKNQLTGWSFGFIKEKDRWEQREGEGELKRRFLEEIRLLEVSLLDVTPAYIATSVERRGEESKLVEHRYVEDEPVRTTITESTMKQTTETEEGIWQVETARVEVETYRLKNSNISGK